jgi:hypothetical protein
LNRTVAETAARSECSAAGRRDSPWLVVIDIQPGGSDVAGFQSCLMAKKPTERRRKLVEFDAPTWHALNLLSRESMKSFQDLADEAFRNLLRKQGRPTDEVGAQVFLANGLKDGLPWPCAAL